MPRTLIIQDTELTAGGGTVNLSVDDYADQYRLFSGGAVTLTSSYTIQPSGTVENGMLYEFHYVADLDFDGNTLTIFGTSIPADLESVEMYIRAYYNGTAWEVTLASSFGDLPLITTSMVTDDNITNAKMAEDSVGRSELIDGDILPIALSSNAVTTVKIANAAVTAEKLGGTLDKEIFAVNVSFEAGEQGNNSIIIPYDCTINSIRWDVQKVIEASDDATVTPQIAGVGTTPSLVTVAAGSGISATGSLSLTSANALSAGEVLKLASSKSTVGGKVLLTVTVTRT